MNNRSRDTWIFLWGAFVGLATASVIVLAQSKGHPMTNDQIVEQVKYCWENKLVPEMVHNYDVTAVVRVICVVRPSEATR